MRTALACLLLVGCQTVGTGDTVAAIADSGGDDAALVDDASIPEFRESDGGAAEDAGYDNWCDAGEGELCPRRSNPTPQLERECTEDNEFTICPDSTGQTPVPLCSPAGRCGFICDVCVVPDNIPESEREAWVGDCEEGYIAGAQYRLVDETVAKCTARGGQCRVLDGSPRSWCTL